MRWKLLRRSEFHFPYNLKTEGGNQKMQVGWTFLFVRSEFRRVFITSIILFTQIKLVNMINTLNVTATKKTPEGSNLIPNVWQYWCFSLGIFPFLGWFKVTIFGSLEGSFEIWCIQKTRSSNLFNNLRSGTWIPFKMELPLNIGMH